MKFWKLFLASLGKDTKSQIKIFSKEFCRVAMIAADKGKEEFHDNLIKRNFYF